MEKTNARYGGLLKSNWTARRTLVPEYTCRRRPSVEETLYKMKIGKVARKAKFATNE